MAQNTRDFGLELFTISETVVGNNTVVFLSIGGEIQYAERFVSPGTGSKARRKTNRAARRLVKKYINFDPTKE